ncbi:hypothetical protein FRC17_000509 [Serendipita sp. 399]|nr:hypothetical protein FRC17_000509 [Serendipita sp. 399]
MVAYSRVTKRGRAMARSLDGPDAFYLHMARSTPKDCSPPQQPPWRQSARLAVHSKTATSTKTNSKQLAIGKSPIDLKKKPREARQANRKTADAQRASKQGKRAPKSTSKIIKTSKLPIFDLEISPRTIDPFPESEPVSPVEAITLLPNSRGSESKRARKLTSEEKTELRTWLVIHNGDPSRVEIEQKAQELNRTVVFIQRWVKDNRPKDVRHVSFDNTPTFASDKKSGVAAKKYNTRLTTAPRRVKQVELVPPRPPRRFFKSEYPLDFTKPPLHRFDPLRAAEIRRSMNRDMGPYPLSRARSAISRNQYLRND